VTYRGSKTNAWGALLDCVKMTRVNGLLTLFSETFPFDQFSACQGSFAKQGAGVIECFTSHALAYAMRVGEIDHDAVREYPSAGAADVR
jgi:hypothetical protein